MRFNPRAREGATSPINQNTRWQTGFNPRAREGATEGEGEGEGEGVVSIHAPVKARLYNKYKEINSRAFQSTRP